MNADKLSYEIKIEGHIHLDWSDYADVISLQHTAEGMTILVVDLPDQTALHGLLMRVRDFGLTLVEIRRIDNSQQSY